MRQHRVKRVGIEASAGGYEQSVVAELRRKRFVVVVFQPAQVRAYAKFHARENKNDRIDASHLCRLYQGARRLCGKRSHAAAGSSIRVIAEPCWRHDRSARRGYRSLNILDRNLYAGMRRSARRLLLADCRSGAAQKVFSRALVAALRRAPDLAKRLGLINSVHGIGLPTAVAILVRLPEIGRITRGGTPSLPGSLRPMTMTGEYLLHPTYRGRPKAIAALPSIKGVAGSLPLESTPHRAVSTPHLPQEKRTKACRLCPQVADLRQYRRRPRNPLGQNPANPQSCLVRRFLSINGCYKQNYKIDTRAPRL